MPRTAPPALLLELADEQDFLRHVERQRLHSRRHGEVLVVLSLQLQFTADVGAALRAEVLSECARRLRSRVRSTDGVLRWPPGRFGVLLLRCEAVHAQAVLQRLTRYAGGPYRLGERLLECQMQGELLHLESR